MLHMYVIVQDLFVVVCHCTGCNMNSFLYINMNSVNSLFRNLCVS